MWQKLEQKSKSCISYEILQGFITNIFKWDNNCYNNERYHTIA